MKIEIKNLGPLKEAKFELGYLTIVCGENNTGKTSATDLLFEVLSLFKQFFNLQPKQEHIDKLVANGRVSIQISEYINAAVCAADFAVNAVIQKTPKFRDKIAISFEKNDFDIDKKCDMIIDYSECIFTGQKAEGTNELIIVFENESSSSWDESSDNVSVNDTNATNAKRAIELILNNCFGCNNFIVCTERTGIAVFQSEINVANGRIVADLKDNNQILINQFLKKYRGHSKPILENMEFLNGLPHITTDKQSFIFNEENLNNDGRSPSRILNYFHNIVGGKYHFKDGMVSFIPSGTEVKLDVERWSSSVRSLMLLNYYLLHIARKNDLLIIDEPELNLHPKNQRRIARLLSQLVNAGIKVLITTHSDYIVRELNTLIMLNKDLPHIKAIKEEKCYQDNEILDAKKVRVYVTEANEDGTYHLTPASIDENGIEVSTFDDTIDELNRIQETILWGD